MDFGSNRRVWLVLPSGKRVAAVAVEPPGDATVYTFAFYEDAELRAHVMAHYPHNPDPICDLNTYDDVDESSWPDEFALLPKGDPKLRRYSIMGTQDRDPSGLSYEDEDIDIDVGDFQCLWDGMRVVPRDEGVEP